MGTVVTLRSATESRITDEGSVCSAKFRMTDKSSIRTSNIRKISVSIKRVRFARQTLA